MHDQPLAYHGPEFLESDDARPMRILAEYLEPLRRFKAAEHPGHGGVLRLGARRTAGSDAKRALDAAAEARGARAAAHAALLKRSRKAVEWSRYYEDARELAHRLTEWSLSLEAPHRRFVVCSGGGPGIMEAANRGAHEAGGKTHRLQHPPAVRAGAEPLHHRAACTSSSTTSSCGSSGSRIWRRRW